MSAPTVPGTLRLSNGLAPAGLDRVVAALGRLDGGFRPHPYAAVTLRVRQRAQFARPPHHSCGGDHRHAA